MFASQPLPRPLQSKFAASTIAFLLLASSFAAARQDTPRLQGEWTGSFDMVAPGGRLNHDRAVLFLKWQGPLLTGSIGDGRSPQSKLDEGAMDQETMHFSIDMRGGSKMYFWLHRDGSHLVGDASSDSDGKDLIAKLDLTRLGDQDHAAPSQSEILFDEIEKMDKTLFDAFNRRDFEGVQKFFAKNLEFYHDKDGLTDYVQNMESFRRHFSETTKIRRELVKGSLEVYPVKNYGAIEVGVHRFYTTEPGQPEQLAATAKFTHIWRRAGNSWQITRVVSYDHR
jgi:ketosteroid isomerase-like protein